MKCIVIALTIAASTSVLVRPSVSAQDSTSGARTFQLRSVSEPEDPDPTKQTTEERIATLRKRMKEAHALFREGKVDECLTEYVDPFWLARAAAGSGWTVEELINKQLLGDRERAEGLATAFGKTIESNLDRTPVWLLDGRVASFITNRSSRTAEFWIYFEGKWRISPET